MGNRFTKLENKHGAITKLLKRPSKAKSKSGHSSRSSSSNNPIHRKYSSSSNLCQRQAMAIHHHFDEDVTETYDIVKVLGQGHLGEILLVHRKARSNGKENGVAGIHNGTLQRSSRLKSVSSPNKTIRAFACKTVHTTRLRREDMAEMLNEIDIMRELDHPNILQLFDVYHGKRKIWLLMELCTGGDLAERKVKLNSMSSYFCEMEVAVIMEQTLRAVAYMHRCNVCHRDIKLENIMFENDSPDAAIKLIDFGLSMKFAGKTKMRKACGTPYTIAPELLGTSGCNEKSDVWSVAVVAYVMLSDEYPFYRDEADFQNEAKSQRLLNARYIFGPAWKQRIISQEAKDFIGNCLRKHPVLRWSAHEALEYVQNKWLPTLEARATVVLTDVTPPSTPEPDPISVAIASHLPNGSSDNSMTTPDQPNNSLQNLRRTLNSRRSRMNSQTLNGLTDFVLFGNMKKMILMTMASTMDKSSLSDLQDLFLCLDKKGTGTITLLELRDALKEMHPDKALDDETIQNLFDGLDRDKSGNIHYKEFLAAVSESQGLITMERLGEAFDRIDSGGKGYISKEDLELILGTDYDQELVHKMIEEADFKKNGQIDYEEFLRLMSFDPGSVGLDLATLSQNVHNLPSNTSHRCHP